jgi:large subunit ribosomal protein L31e
MAEQKTTKLERTYVIPLRSEWLKVPYYKRARRAVKAIKEFVARHMHVPERDLDRVKLDVYFNNELWFRGKTNPPSKVKVRVIKEDDLVKVDFAEVPQHVKFLRAKHAKFHKASGKKAEKKEEAAEKPSEETAEEKKEEKKAEIEKEKSVEIRHEAEIKAQQKAQKHTTKTQTAQHPVRQALNK